MSDGESGIDNLQKLCSIAASLRRIGDECSAQLAAVQGALASGDPAAQAKMCDKASMLVIDDQPLFLLSEKPGRRNTPLQVDQLFGMH